MGRVEDLLLLERAGELPANMQKDLDLLRAAGEIPGGEKTKKPEATTSMADDLKSYGKTAARVGLGVAGSVAGVVAGTVAAVPAALVIGPAAAALPFVGGAAGSGLAETVSQWLFDDKFSPKQIALQTLLGALPGAKFPGIKGVVGRTAIRGLEGGAVGTGAAGASESIETGDWPSWGTLAKGFGLGTFLGGGFGAAEAKLPGLFARKPGEPPLTAEQQARADSIVQQLDELDRQRKSPQGRDLLNAELKKEEMSAKLAAKRFQRAADADAVAWAKETNPTATTGKVLPGAATAEESQFNRFMGVEPTTGRNRRVPGEVGGPEIPGVIKPPAPKGNQFEANAGVPPEAYPGGIPNPPGFRKGTAADVPPYPRDVTPGSPVRPTGVEGDIATADRAMFESQRATEQVNQAASQAELFASRGAIPGPEDVTLPRGFGVGPVGERTVPRLEQPGSQAQYPRLGLPAPESNPIPGPGGDKQATLNRIRELEAQIAEKKAELAGSAPSNEAAKQEAPPSQAQTMTPKNEALLPPAETPAPAAPVEPPVRVPGVDEVPVARAPTPPETAARAAPAAIPEAAAPQGKITSFDFGESPVDALGLKPAVRIDGEIRLGPEGATSHAQIADLQADMLSKASKVESGWIDKSGKFYDSVESAQVAQMTVRQKVKTALGGQEGAAPMVTGGEFGPRQQANMRLAKAARADLYREISETAARTGRKLHEVAADMDVVGPVYRRLIFEHSVDQASKAFGDAADKMTKLNERANIVGPEARVIATTGNVSRETRPELRASYGNKKPDTYHMQISEAQKAENIFAIQSISEQLGQARRVAASMGDRVTAQQFDEVTKNFDKLTKDMNREANKFNKLRLAGGRFVESYKRVPWSADAIDEMNRLGYKVDQARTLRDKIPIASNIKESVGKMLNERSFKALSTKEQGQFVDDVINHARYDLFGPLTATFDLISNSVRAGVEAGPVGLFGDAVYGVRTGNWTMPNTAGLIRAIGVRRPGRDWPGMPQFLDDALAPAKQAGDTGLLSRRSSPVLDEKLGRTFAGEPIPGNLGITQQVNRPSQWGEKGIFKTDVGHGVFTRRETQASAGYDTIAGLPLYSKAAADAPYKNIFGNGLIWREAFMEADKQGLRGIDRQRFADNFWQNIPKSVMDDAFSEANKAGWNRPLSPMYERWARYPLFKLIVDPFGRWSAQFGKWTAEMLGAGTPALVRKYMAGTLGPEEAARHLARMATGWGGVYAIDRLFNQNPNGAVDYKSGEWVDAKSGDRQRLSNFEPVITSLMLGQVMKAGYAASTGDHDGAKEHLTKATQVMRFSSLPMLKFLYGDGGLLGGPLGAMMDGLKAGNIDTQRVHDEVTNLANHLIPGQAILSFIKSVSDPTLREGLGANIPGVSYLTDHRIDLTTGGTIEPTQRLFGASGPEVKSIGGTPLPGARRILTPIAATLSKYGLMEYRGPRLPIAGYRPDDAPEEVTREWQTELGKARNQILSQVLPSIQDAERRAPPGGLKPDSPYYEQIRKTLATYDAMAVKHANDVVNQRHLSRGQMPRRKTVRELSRQSEVE